MKRELTYEEFNILVGVEGNKLTEGIKASPVYRKLKEKDFIDSGELTDKGLEALEPYCAKRAIFLAAGLGNRLRPITLNTPKPLIRVHGKRLIDGLLDACLAAGIKELYIVRGYLGEQFDQLLSKYPMVRFIENPNYNEANNIFSALQAKHLLKNAYVFEADLLIKNPSIIQKYHYLSSFLGIAVEHSDDWCFTVQDGIIREQKIGGEHCFQEVGISYWDKIDGEKLERHLQLSYAMPDGEKRYWDQVPFCDFPEEYHVQISECSLEDVMEIDTFEELKKIDNNYDV